MQGLNSNRTLLNVFSNYVLNEIVTFNDKDPTWMTKFLKSQIHCRNNVYQECHRKGNHSAGDFIFLENIISEVSDLMFNRKSVYYTQLAQKLNDPKTSSKTYWSISKTFYDSKKVPLIPPLFINDKSEPDFKLKANIFNNFFTDKCIQMQNNSVIPNFLEFELMKRLTSIVFNEESILKTIRALHVMKGHGHDDISIRMTKFYDKSIVPAILLIYKNCVNSGISPNVWKKSNIVPAHKKGDKQVVDNYRPVSLLPIFGKIFESLIFNRYLNFFLKTICLKRINQDLDHLIHVNINSY